MLKHLGTRGLAPQRGARPERGQPRASVRSFRPRLEILESRVYPGDTILGLWALALWAPSFASPDGATGSYRAQSEREWQRGLLSPLDVAASFSAFALLQDSAGALDGGGSAGDRVATLGTTSRADSPLFIDDILAGRVAGHRLGIPALPGSQALSVNFIGTPAGPGAPWSGVSAAFFAAAFAGTLTRSASSASDASLAGGASPLSTRSNLSFDTASGQLAIRANAGEHTVREALAADGFVDVTFDGQHHSSNPSSVSFDRALVGATGATVAGIRFDSGGQDTLILGSQHLAGGFRVQATGATVVTENVVTAGPLAIKAPNITVSGALQGSRVALAASDWVIVNAAGRIDAGPSHV